MTATSKTRTISEAFVPRHGVILQRKCVCGHHDRMDGKCEECNKKREGTSQRAARGPLTTGKAPPIVHEVLRSPGQPIDGEARAFMEPRFAHDFSHVRLHTDSRAAESARAVDALAYTVGHDVVFREGQYKPSTYQGRRLLAHELTHTIQQAAVTDGPCDGINLGSAASPYETEANAWADLVVSGQKPTHRISTDAHSSSHLQRIGMGDLRLAEARQAEEERMQKGCGTRAQGTLSEVSWGETSGLYPAAHNKYDPAQWDATKTCELLRARGAIHAIGQRGEKVHRAKPGAGTIEQKLKPYHFYENFLSLDPEIGDSEVKWFYLSAKSSLDAHPTMSTLEWVKKYGPFYNDGGGDVPRGEVYIHFYRRKKQSRAKSGTDTLHRQAAGSGAIDSVSTTVGKVPSLQREAASPMPFSSAVQPQSVDRACGIDFTQDLLDEISTATDSFQFQSIKAMLAAAGVLASADTFSAQEILEGVLSFALLAQAHVVDAPPPSQDLIRQLKEAKDSRGEVTIALATRILRGPGAKPLDAALVLLGIAAKWWAGIIGSETFDFKKKPALKCGVTLCPDQAIDCFESSLPGNLFFGYMGAYLGFSTLALQLGSQIANLREAGGWDSPDDTLAVKLGATAPRPLTRDSLCAILEQYGSDLLPPQWTPRAGCRP